MGVAASACEMRSAVRDYAQVVTMDRYPAVDAKHIPLKPYYRLFVELGDNAAASASDGDISAFKGEVLSEIEWFMTGLADVVRSGDGECWRHKATSPLHLKGRSSTDLSRHDLEATVGCYLALPARSAAVDRILVDMLIACEFFDYASEVYGESNAGAGFRRGSGPLGFLGRRLASAIVFAIPIGAAAVARNLGWLSEDWATIIIIGAIALFALESLWGLFVFPFAWRAQNKHNATIAKLLKEMGGVYSEMNSGGPISARHIRERAQAATSNGVCWPAPLFAILDDSISRTGTF